MIPAVTAAPLHATREQWLNAFIAAVRPHFTESGKAIPDAVRVSIGYPSSGIRSKTIGECWASEVSADGHFEIFIHPGLKSASHIADVLTHELVHAAVGLKAKHGPAFKALAVALGLGGKMTATVATDEWHLWADPVVAALGDYPGAALTGASHSGKPKQGTRLIKIECPECGFVARTTKKWIAEAVEAAQALDADPNDDGQGGYREDEEDEGEREPVAALICPMPSHRGAPVALTIETPDEEGGE